MVLFSPLDLSSYFAVGVQDVAAPWRPDLPAIVANLPGGQQAFWVCRLPWVWPAVRAGLGLPGSVLYNAADAAFMQTMLEGGLAYLDTLSIPAHPHKHDARRGVFLQAMGELKKRG